MSWRSIFYSISSTRISIKSALLGSNLYYYFTVGKARIRSACNFVIMVIVAGPDPFQGLEPQISYVSHYRFDQGHLAYEYSPALESVSRAVSKRTGRLHEEARNSFQLRFTLDPPPVYQSPITEHRLNLGFPAIHVRLKSCDPSLTIIERKSCTSVTPGVETK